MSTPLESVPFLLEWDEDDDFSDHWAAAEAAVVEPRTAHTLDIARRWCAGDDVKRRAAALDLLALLGRDDEARVPEFLAEAERVVGHGDHHVRWSAAHGLSVVEGVATLPTLLRFVADPDPRVRGVVAATLPMLVDDAADPAEDPALLALLTLALDIEADVRDWAVFGIGSQTEADTPQIRETLLAALDDTEGATAGEAAVGLARRKDGRVLDRLLTELADQRVGNLYVEAAGELGDPRLHPLLRALDAAGWRVGEPMPMLLDEALAACDPERRPGPADSGEVRP